MKDIRAALQSAFLSGTPATISVDDLIAAHGDDTTPWYVVVDVDLDTDSTVTAVAANVFTALGLSAHETIGAVPASLIGNIPNLADEFQLTRASFTLLPANRSLVQITLTAALKKDALTIRGVDVVVKNVVVTVDQPLSASRYVTLSAQGTVSKDGTAIPNLGFTVTLPDCVLSFDLLNSADGVDIDTLLAAAGIDTDVFQAFSLTELDFTVDLLTHGASVSIEIEPTTSASRAALDAQSGFALGPLSLYASVGTDGADAGFSAQMTYTSQQSASDPLVFEAAASFQSGQGWTLLAACSPGANPHIAPAGSLPLPALLNALDLKVGSLPLGLDQVGLQELQLATTLEGGKETFTLTAEFDTTLHIDSDTELDAQAAIVLTRAPVASGALGGSTYEISGSIALTLGIDGFSFVITYDFTKESKELAIAATFDSFNVDGTYVLGSKRLNLDATPKAGVSLGDLLAEVIGLVTGNKEHRLPAPLDILNDFVFTEIDVQIDLGQRSFGVTLANLDIEIVPGMLSVTQLGISYASTGTHKGFGIAIAYGINGGPSGSLVFDPTAGSAAPIPELGLPLLQINAAVAGQNVSVSTSSTDVDTVLNSAVALLQPTQPQGSPLGLPDFGPGGWVLGASLLIKQQIALRFVFDDPDFYGAALTILPPPANTAASPYLQALVGLEAEISYHKIDDTLGVYSASLTLPRSTNPGASGSITLPLCSVQLPSIALQMYTDGDFLVNVGFPYSLNFANSLTVNIEEYVGSGGVYFGHLSGADAPTLKDAPAGLVGTITELGVGMQLGIYYSENFGPLSGSLSITAQGLFEGTFAEITVPKAGSVEYYDITAALSISGALSAEINFFIVSASLYVAINICAQVNAIYEQPVIVQVKASVDVTLEAEIDLGFFSISKSFSFSATLSDSFALSARRISTGTKQPGSLHLFSNQQTLAGAFASCPLTADVTVWLTPVLTLKGPEQWVYVLDFTVSTDAPTATAVSPFYTLLELVFGTFVYAYLLRSNQILPGTVSFDTLKIDADGLQELDGLVRALTTEPENGFDMDDLNRLLTQSLQLVLQEVGPKFVGTKLNVASFPLVPGSTWDFNLVPQSIHSSNVSHLARDYFVMLAHSVIGYARDQFIESSYTAPQSVSVLMAAMNAANPSRVVQTAGLTTRFLMHGNQVKGTATSVYLASGLEPSLDLTKDREIQFDVIPPVGPPISISTASRIPSQTLFTIAQIAAFKRWPAVSSATWRLMPATFTLPHVFATRAVTKVSGGSLWRLPRALTATLEQRGATPNFLLGVSNASDTIDPDKIVPLDHANYEFATVIDIVLSKEPSLADEVIFAIYGIHSIRGRSRQRLTDLVTLMLSDTPPTLSKVEIAYPTAIGPDGSATAIETMEINNVNEPVVVYVENFSAQTFGYAPLATELIPTAAEQLLYSLQACALTNRGGYYLAGALPQTSFDSQGLATISVVVSFAPAGGGSDVLAAHHCAVRVTGDVEGDALVTWTPNITETRRNYMPGVIGVEVTVAFDDPLDEKDGRYVGSLNRLFHLVGMAPVITGPDVPSIDLSDSPLIASPLKSGQPRVYQRTLNVFDYGGTQKSPYVRFGNDPVSLPDDPSMAQDPYALVGMTVDMSHSTLVDTFGNSLPLTRGGIPSLTPLMVQWTDDLVRIDQWPGLTTRYQVNHSPTGPVLSLLLDWSPPAHADHATTNRLLQRYMDIFFQLERVDAALGTTMLRGDAWPFPGSVSLASRLQSSVRSLLKNIASALDYSDRIDLVSPPAATFNTAALFPLSVDLRFSLKPNVPVAGEDPSIFTVAAAIYPDQWQQNQPSQSAPAKPGWNSSPTVFASALEASFASGEYKLDYRVMSGERDESGDPTCWLLRYGADSLHFSLDAPKASGALCAPQPLARHLIDRPSTVPPSGVSSDAPSGPQGQMDLDASMRRFTDTLDAFLRPASAAAASLLLGQAPEMAQFAKWVLAHALSGYVLDTQTGEKAPPAAVEIYRQGMLKSAKSYYSIDGALPFDLTAYFGEKPLTDQMAIYGNLAYLDGDKPQATFSPSSAILNGGDTRDAGVAGMAFGMTAHDLTAERTLTTPGRFQLKAIRTDLAGLAVVPTAIQNLASRTASPNINFRPYLTGRWLHFVTTAPVIDVAPRTVKIPLRALPVAPTPISQTFAQDQSSAGTSATLTDLKAWTLSSVMRRRAVVRDVVSVLFDANVSVNPPGQPSAEPVNPLVQALANFDQLWAASGALLGTAMIDGATDPATFNAVQGMCEIFDDVAEAAWDGLPDAPPVVTATAAFLVAEAPQGDDPDSPWTARVDVDPLLSVLPSPGRLEVAISDTDAKLSGGGNSYIYSYEHAGSPLTATEALAITDRTFALHDTLDIIGAQNGTVSFSILRNIDLAEPFQYSTSLVTLPKPILPHVEQSTFFDISTLCSGTERRPLSEYLTAYFFQLLASSLPGATTSLKLQITLETAFAPTPNNPGMPYVARPLGFLPALDVQIGWNQTQLMPLVYSLCEQVGSWVTTIGTFDPDASPWHDLYLRVRTTVYTEWQGVSTTPLLTLTGASVPFSRLEYVG